MDPIAFLRRYDPFSRLDDAGLAVIGRVLEVRYARRGEIVLRRGGEPTTHLGVVRKGAVRLEVDGRIVGTLGVVGPMRMPYDRMIQIVDITARLVSHALSQK